MVRAGVNPKELAIQHVGKPGERVPVAHAILGARGREAGRGVRGKSPANSLESNASLHRLVLRNVVRVIEVVEFKIPDARINGDGQQSNDGARDQQGEAVWGMACRSRHSSQGVLGGTGLGSSVIISLSALKGARGKSRI